MKKKPDRKVLAAALGLVAAAACAIAGAGAQAPGHAAAHGLPALDDSRPAAHQSFPVNKSPGAS
jgi:hypothetical protein